MDNHIITLSYFLSLSVKRGVRERESELGRVLRAAQIHKLSNTGKLFAFQLGVFFCFFFTAEPLFGAIAAAVPLVRSKFG